MDALRTLVPKAQERRARVRLVGVSLGQLVENQHQLKLFSPERDVQWEQVLTKVDAIRGKHGFQSLQTGKSLGQARPKDQRRREKDRQPRERDAVRQADPAGHELAQ